MKFLVFFILIINSCIADKIVLSNDDLVKLTTNPNKNYVINRLNLYSKLLKESIDLPEYKKLIQVNTFFNKIFPVEDSTKYAKDDYWATPKEFMINGNGDCEDYVISKYFTLLELDISKDKLYFCVVKVVGESDYHMVLLYKKDDNLFVLDNLNKKIQLLENRKDLEPKYAFNEYESRLIQNSKLFKKVNINWKGENKFENILKRVRVLNK